MKRYFGYLCMAVLIGTFAGALLPVGAETYPTPQYQPGTTGQTGLDKIKENLSNIGPGLGFGNGVQDPFSVVAKVINIFLGAMGVLFLALMVYGGYLWMTAMGEEEKITKSKDTIVPAVIGLIIILAAYSLTTFVIKGLVGAVQPGTTTLQDPLVFD